MRIREQGEWTMRIHIARRSIGVCIAEITGEGDAIGRIPIIIGHSPRMALKERDGDP